ncbi:MAG: 5'/3'-nucleotidase SurE [Christensenellaceae bacterium]|jgi:5'-nucleotidase|nr:5'/3'-nucleotidase SurE [Christensenellaceae bacterium]
MKILIANDMGFEANELRVLAEVLNQKHRITICGMGTPAHQRGNSFSMQGEPIRFDKMRYRLKSGEIDAYKFFGTPADMISVMLGCIMENKRPDLVICGINNGLTLGTDKFCSSNIGMAMESVFFNVPSLAVALPIKLGGHTAEEILPACNFIEKNLEKIKKIKLPTDTFLNISFPIVEKYKDYNGVEVISVMDELTSLTEYDEKIDVNGDKYYWTKYLNKRKLDEKNTAAAVSLLADKKIIISPLSYNRTDYDALDMIKKNKGNDRKTKIKKILLVNEAGCFTPGIIALAKELNKSYRVTVVAPLNSFRGVGHAITTYERPLRSKQWFLLNGIKIWSVDGTPCDCVALAMNKILRSKPDLIISGIDYVNNRGEMIYSSGTVSAAFEGAIHDIPSMAVSANIKDKMNERAYSLVTKFIYKNLGVLFNDIPKGGILNVNFPSKIDTKQVCWTHLTDGLLDNKYELEVNPFGRTFAWLQNKVESFGMGVLEDKGDFYFLKKGHITITPLRLSMMNPDAAEKVLNIGVEV